MDDRRREEVALFRHSIIGSLLHGELRRGELHSRLESLAKDTYTGPDGVPTQYHWKTLETWYYLYRQGGLAALYPKTRKDRGAVRALSGQTVELIQDLKREDPGRSAALILRELELAGRIQPKSVSLSTIGRILKNAGLSGPKLELEHPERYRWRAAHTNDIWQGDALHGPPLVDPRTDKRRKTIIFGLLDDRSRLGIRVWAGVRETEEAFLHVLYEAMGRRGIPRALLLDRHASFRGHGLRLVCAHLGIRLIYTRPKDGPGKGAVERWWRTLRKHLLDRVDLGRVRTIDDLNTRLITWCESEYNHRPHSGLGGRTPMEVWREEADEVRWVEDYAALEALFVGRETRKALNDSTIRFRGVTYEVPCHLRRRKVEIRYSLLNPERIWIEDGAVEVPLAPVDPERNATRARKTPQALADPKPSTGLNHVELLLDRICGRRPKEDDHA